jgi:hypothetical protein
MYILLIYLSVEGRRYPNVSKQRKLNASGAYYVRTHRQPINQ